MFNAEKIEKTVNITCDSPDFTQTRLDKLLFDHFPEYSRAYFQKLINENLILVNSKINKKGSYKVKKLDEITVNFPEIKQFDLSPKKVDFEIIDIQDDFIIVNKPAGLIVHPASKTQNDEVTLVNGLLYKFEELNKFSQKERPGIVHRLDKGTSGLLIVARTTTAQIKFSEMFKKRLMKKTYLAVVKGHPSKKGKVDLEIGRHPYKKHMMSHVSYQSKNALTYYEVLKYYKDCSLLAVRIVTGRTHQIRVHLAAIGHGLLGDDVYGIQSKLISHPALHAWKLEFEFKNKNFSYCKHVPEDFKELLISVKK